MTTQYTPILKLALPVEGELTGTWGDVVNNNITSMVEQAIAGRASINTWTSNSHTLTTANGVTSESRCMVLDLSGTLTGTGQLVIPSGFTKVYVVRNGTTGGYPVLVGLPTGDSVQIPNGQTTIVYADSTDTLPAVTCSPVDMLINGVTVGVGSGSGSNTALGYAVLSALTSGGGLTAVGYQALTSNSTGANGTAVGYQALTSNTTGDNSTAVGYLALAENLGGGDNTAVGASALGLNTSGDDNTAVGADALAANLTGSGNVALGGQTLYQNTTGVNNVAVGFQSQRATTATGNTSLGAQALGFSRASGDNNVAIGYQAATALLAGQNNVAVGYLALSASGASGSGNVVVGSGAGASLTSGASNVFVGPGAGAAVTTGAGNVILGAYAGSEAATATNFIFFADGSSNLRGGFSTNGVQFYQRPDPFVTSTANYTLTGTDLCTTVVIWNGGASTMYLPTGTSLSTALGPLPVNASFEFSVINNGGVGSLTLDTNTGMSRVGNFVIAVGTSARFRATKAGTNSYTVYRIA